MKEKAISTISTVPADSGTERKRESGSRGSRLLVCQKTKRAKATAEPARKSRVRRSLQDQSEALISAQMRQNIAADSSRMPRTSKDRGAFSSRWSLRMTRPRASATAPTGRLMKNTDCQLTCSTSSPPTMGPPAVEAPTTMPHRPMAMLSFSAGKAARSRPSAAGISRAPHRPCTTRRPTTTDTLPDTAMSPEDRAKPVVPIRKISRWPKRSPSLPAVISATARARR